MSLGILYDEYKFDEDMLMTNAKLDLAEILKTVMEERKIDNKILAEMLSKKTYYVTDMLSGNISLKKFIKAMSVMKVDFKLTVKDLKFGILETDKNLQL